MTGLLLVDIQNDYFPGGAMEVEGSVAAAGRAAELLSLFREKRLPVFHVRHVSVRPGATFFLPGTFGAEIHETVTPREGEPVTVKNFPNSFRETDLLASLRKAGVTRLVVAGMMTHMCIDSTVRAAFDIGLSTVVVSDACATRTLVLGGESVPAAQVQLAFLAALGAVHAQVKSAAEVKAEM